jgi:uncharacterized protein YbjQ (UPF0145 family)
VIVVTSASVAGKRVVRTLGLVRGTSVRAHHLGQDILAYFRNMVGGELEECTKMLAEAREQAIDRMIADAERMGANAIVDVRFGTSDIATGAAEILVYGTAVHTEDLAPET